MKYNERVYRREDFTEGDVRTIMGLAESKGSAAPAAGAPAAATPAPGSTAAPAPGAAPAAAAPAPGAAPAAAASPAPTEGLFDIKTLGFKTPDELTQRLNNISTLEKELTEAKAQPKFKSDRAKFLYDYANRHEGMESEAALNLLHLVNLPLEKLADHQLRYEAFKLKPENKGLSQDDVMALFTDYELQTYGDPKIENGQSKVQAIKAQQATAQAKAEIQGIVQEWDKTRPVEPDPAKLLAEQAEYRNFVKETLSTFDGLNDLKLSGLGEDGKTIESVLNFKIDEQQREAVVGAIADPQGWWVSLLERHQIMKPGTTQIDQRKFAALVTKIEHADELLNQTYQQGRSDQLADRLKGRRNPDGSAIVETPGAGGAPVKSELQMMGEGALKVVGG